MFQVLINNVEEMQISKGEDNGGQIEACDVQGKSLSMSEVVEEFTSGNIGQEHVDVEAVLEGRVQIDNERVPYMGQDGVFHINMLHLSKSDDLRLVTNLESKTVDRPCLEGRSAESNEQHMPKCASTWALWIRVVKIKMRERLCSVRTILPQHSKRTLYLF